MSSTPGYAGAAEWFGWNPEIRSTYIARGYFGWNWRSSIGDMGSGNSECSSRYPATLRWRQALPPLFVLSMVVLSCFPSFDNLHESSYWPAEIIFYLLMLMAAGDAACDTPAQAASHPGFYAGDHDDAFLMGQRISMESGFITFQKT